MAGGYFRGEIEPASPSLREQWAIGSSDTGRGATRLGVDGIDGNLQLTYGVTSPIVRLPIRSVKTFKRYSITRNSTRAQCPVPPNR